MPDADTALRIAALCVMLASAETLHGIARTVLVVPRIGKERALKLSALTGTLLAFGICAAMVPGLRLASGGAHLLLGIGLSLFMAGFDIAMGRWVMRRPWARIWPDFNPAGGNYLLFGLAALAVIPWVIWALAG
jgi:hypothetical protein